MTMAQNAQDFRNLTDAQYADVVNGRLSIEEAIAQVRRDRETEAKKITAAVIATNYDDPESDDVLADLLDMRALDADDVRSLIEAAALAGLEAAR